MLRDSALGFLRDSAPVSHLRKLRDSRDECGYSPALWQHFAEMGFTGVLVPEAHGGLGLGHVEAGIVMEAIGRNLTPVPFLSSAVVAASLLARHGSAGQQQAYLPSLARGARIMTLAVDEGLKHRPGRIATRAEADGDDFRLDGSKLMVVDGHVADTLIVAARTHGDPDDGDGLSLFLISRSAPGVEVERTVMVDAHNAARVTLRGVRAAASDLIGAAGAGRAALEHALDAGRVALAAELLGIADEAFARTVGYLKERKQFGRLIGEFQALQHRAAQLYTDLEITRALVLRACQALDEGAADAAALASAAKARAGTTATLAVQEGVQMHGGIGMTDEFEIGFFMKRARVAQELLGDANFHADRWARIGGY